MIFNSGGSVMAIAGATVSLFVFLVVLASNAGEEESGTLDALVIPDERCRNSATTTFGDQTWRVAELLPAHWEGLSSVNGVVEISGDEYFFAASGHRLRLTKTLEAPTSCVPWTFPSRQTDGQA